jgi:hypothetical protein
LKSAALWTAGGVAALAALALAALAPAAAARGWLIGFLACATPVLGAVALTLIGELTGGRWVARTRPVAAASPGLMLLFLPLGLGLAWIYPWTTSANLPGHAGLYLTDGFFLARNVVALGVWGALGWVLAHRQASRVVLGLGLLAHAILSIIVGFDWVLSLRPGWVSSDFPMNLIAQQVAAGAALTLLTSSQAPDPERRDLAALVAAGVLGVAYLAFMDYLIVWYGNLPDRVGWYLARRGGASPWLVSVALIVGALAAPLVLVAPRLTARFKTGTAAALALVGLFAYQLYLLAPALGWITLAAAIVSTVAQAAVLIAVACRWPPVQARELAHA